MTSEEDKVLIKGSLAGNDYSKGQLYKKYVKAMYYVSVRMVVDSNKAQDLTQDSFVKVFEKLGQFKGTSTLGAWIKTITVNTCLTYLKKQGRLRFDDLDEQILEIPEPKDGYEGIDVSKIHNQIKLLPDGCRNILNMYLLEGYQHKEIANKLGISESTSRTQYRRAKMILRKKLTQYYNEER